MKKILISVVAAGFFLSCNKLDVTPPSSITTAQLYTTQSNAITGITGVYASLTFDATGDQTLYGRNLYFLTDMGSDYAGAGTSAINPYVQAISKAAWDANTDRLEVAWKQIYIGINLANIAIDNLPTSQVADPLKTRLINEAKFIRGLLYFDAVRLWGAVPLVLHAPASLDPGVLNAGRSPVDSVYKQIVSDLTSAQSLPASYSSTDLGRATSGAATSLLAKVYLTRRDWPNAATTARSVVTSGTYNLFTNFFDAFNKNTKNGIEHIFSAQFAAGQGPTNTNGNTLTRTSFSGFVAIQPADVISDTTLFYNIYQPGDTRRDISYAKKLYNPATGSLYTFPLPLFRKYLDTTNLSGTANTPVNNPIIRYADVLLTLAEADNEQNGGPNAEAYEAINEVRRRAFGYPIHNTVSPVDLNNINTPDQSTFREAVFNERLLEFVQEGQRWFDLVRRGINTNTGNPYFVDALKKVATKQAVSAKDTLYPIPQPERNINPIGLYQNPGY